MDVVVFRAGFDRDWLVDDNYECGFTKEVHQKVKKMMTANPDMSLHTRVVLMRLWSNRFEVHHIVKNTEFNNLQIFILTMRAHEGKRTKHHTWPLDMCFKTKLTHDIFIHLLQEIYSLQYVSKKYWGKEKQLHETICFIDMVRNYLPER